MQAIAVYAAEVDDAAVLVEPSQHSEYTWLPFDTCLERATFNSMTTGGNLTSRTSAARLFTFITSKSLDTIPFRPFGPSARYARRIHCCNVAANARTSRRTSGSFDKNINRLASGSSTIRAVGTPASKSRCHFESRARLPA